MGRVAGNVSANLRRADDVLYRRHSVLPRNRKQRPLLLFGHVRHTSPAARALRIAGQVRRPYRRRIKYDRGGTDALVRPVATVFVAAGLRSTLDRQLA